MKDPLKKFKEKYYMDNDMVGIARNYYKEEAFKETILFIIKNNELNENYFDESLNKIKPFLINNNLIICHTPIVMYKKNSLVIDNVIDINMIEKSLNDGLVVLIYKPVFSEDELKYKGCVILDLDNSDLNTEINKCSDKLIKKGVEYGGNSIDVNKDMFEIFKKLKYFHLKDNDTITQHVGSLSGRYLIYINENIPNNQIIIYNKNSAERELLTILI